MTKHTILKGVPFRIPNVGNIYKYDKVNDIIIYVSGFDLTFDNPSMSYLGQYCMSIIYKNIVTGDNHCKTVYYSDLIEAKMLPCT